MSQRRSWNLFGAQLPEPCLDRTRTAEGEHSEPIFATSSFVFDSAAEAAARFSGEVEGNIYSRFTNPTVRAFEERLAAMEGGESCVATASGMSAILATCMGLLEHGDHILSSRSIFGSTTMLFNKYLSRFGITTGYATLSDIDDWERRLTPQTRMLFVETPSNPLTELGDIRALAELAHAHDCLLVVDNCFCTPVLQRPLDLGADKQPGASHGAAAANPAISPTTPPPSAITVVSRPARLSTSRSMTLAAVASVLCASPSGMVQRITESSACSSEASTGSR